MGKRLLMGLLEGLSIGAALAAAVVLGLGMTIVGAVIAYGLIAAAGALTALVAGKPIWAKEAKLEVGLKAVVGVVVSLVALFALRKWLTVTVDLSAFGAGSGNIGELPAVFIPAITTGLALLFELDHDDSERATGKKRIEASRARVAGLPEASEKAPAEGTAAPRARRKG